MTNPAPVEVAQIMNGNLTMNPVKLAQVKVHEEMLGLRHLVVSSLRRSRKIHKASLSHKEPLFRMPLSGGKHSPHTGRVSRVTGSDGCKRMSLN